MVRLLLLDLLVWDGHSRWVAHHCVGVHVRLDLKKAVLLHKLIEARINLVEEVEGLLRLVLDVLGVDEVSEANNTHDANGGVLHGVVVVLVLLDGSQCLAGKQFLSDFLVTLALDLDHHVAVKVNPMVHLAVVGVANQQCKSGKLSGKLQTNSDPRRFVEAVEIGTKRRPRNQCKLNSQILE